jgi:hypothetical protein
MKIIIALVMALVSVAAAFSPAASSRGSTVTLFAENPQQSRKAFVAAAAAALFTAGSVGSSAFAMDQELVTDPTEVWETGRPSADAEAARIARFAAARNQKSSNFAPIKRLTLERKSPVVSASLSLVVPWGWRPVRCCFGFQSKPSLALDETSPPCRLDWTLELPTLMDTSAHCPDCSAKRPQSLPNKLQRPALPASKLGRSERYGQICTSQPFCFIEF